MSTNKYLEKIAFNYTSAEQVYKTFNRRVSKKPIWYGAGAGVTLGLASAPINIKASNRELKELRRPKLSKTEEKGIFVTNPLIIGAAGAYAGHILRGSSINGTVNRVINSLNRIKSRKAAAGAGGSFYRSHRPVSDIMKDLGRKNHFSTKAEASKHYRSMAMKHHPDRGGDVSKMQTINKAWDEFKNHPEGFEKLASAGLENKYLEKVAEFVLE